MNRAHFLVWVLSSLLLTSLLLTGCGGTEAPTPTPTVTAPPTPVPTSAAVVAVQPPTTTPTPFPTGPTVTPTSAPQVDLAGGFVTADGVLTAFRSQGTLTITTTFPDETVSQTQINYQGRYRSSLNSYGFNEGITLAYSVTGDAVTGNAEGGNAEGDAVLPQEEVVLYSVDDQVAIFAQDQWLVIGRDQVTNFMQTAEIFSDPLRRLTQRLIRAEELEEDVINGIETVRYRSQDPAIFVEAAAADLLDGEDLSDVVIDIWVAKEGRYVVRYAISAQIDNAVEINAEQEMVDVDQRLDWFFEIYDANDETITITLPDDLPDPSALNVPGFAPNDFPLPSEATLQPNNLGQPTIEIPLAEEEVVQFYEERLAELGWQVEGGFGVYQATNGELMFEMIIEAEENGTTTVQIFTQ